MAGLIDDFGGPLPEEPDTRGRPAELYGALVRTIAGQQLSVLAARAIWRKLLAHFDGRVPTPQEILDEDPECCGPRRASRARRSSTCARWPTTCSPAQLELDRLAELPDDEVIGELTAVKGIGEWSAHMFLMFTLHRPDVLPVGDLGVRNAAMRAYGLAAPPARGARGARRGVAAAPDARVALPLAQPREPPV